MNNFMVYLPSLLTRYSIQLMVIALPWILQSKTIDLASISMTLGIFYVASILVGIKSLSFIHRMNIRKTLILTIFIQAIASALCFFTTDLLYLSFLRAIQGGSTGLLRPLNQIWLINFYHNDECPNSRAKRATFGQVYVAIGMALGSFLGSLVIEFVHPQLFGTVICLLPSFACIYFLPKEKISINTLPAIESLPNFSKTKAWFLKDYNIMKVFLYYLLSLVIFKIWIVELPFTIRSDSSLIDPKVLILTLTLHPLLFSFSQLLIGIFLNRINTKNETSSLIVGLSTMLQGILIYCTLFTTSPLLFSILLLAGGAILPAFIYPFLSKVIMQSLKGEIEIVKRNAMVLLSLSADIGQVIGSLLLMISFHSGPMVQMLFPVSLILFIFFINFFMSTMAKTRKERKWKTIS